MNNLQMQAFFDGFMHSHPAHPRNKITSYSTESTEYCQTYGCGAVATRCVIIGKGYKSHCNEHGLGHE